MDAARIRLGRIRCLLSSIECMKKGEPLPPALCFVPNEITYQYEGTASISIYDKPDVLSTKIGELPEKKPEIKLVCSGLPHFSASGGWVKMVSPSAQKLCSGKEVGWMLLQPKDKPHKGTFKIVADEKKYIHWLKVVERCHSLQVMESPPLNNTDEEMMGKLSNPPPGWNIEADEALARFLVQHDSFTTIAAGTSGTECIENISASSEEGEAANLLDEDRESYWESDGQQGEHWLRFTLKPGVVIDSFFLLIDSDDSSYLPKHVVVKAGYSPDDLKQISSRHFTHSDYSGQELNVLQSPLDVFYPLIEVQVKSCYQSGIDVRIHGVKLATKVQSSVFFSADVLNKDMFIAANLARYPKLQSVDPQLLWQRAIILKRLAKLLDMDLLFILPTWEYATSTLSPVTALRQLWPLSSKRTRLIHQMLADTATKSPGGRPVLHIDRRSAADHKNDPSLDPSCKKTVFMQMFNELKKKKGSSTKYDYRWTSRYSQWWECKFTGEGIIDQGGGFRDSLCDLAEELCPSTSDTNVPLPFFVRSPNQNQDSSNAYRDVYAPNPSCKLFPKYEWIGQLMGAMYRSQETLILSLPQFVWKQLVGEPVTWTRDYISVDSAEAKFIDSIETMNKEKFNEYFSGSLFYTTVLSNKELVPLLPDGEAKPVTYENRMEYCQLVKRKRMEESKEQIAAIRTGLIKVIPEAVLDLLTWEELELKVCGNPEITLEALKKSTRYDDTQGESHPDVKRMWKVVESFTNEDRSRLLRFVTGRRRLPAIMHISMLGTSHTDSLPTSATCSNTLYLPHYTSFEVATEKLKYAAYNCIAIDTDLSPWDE